MTDNMIIKIIMIIVTKPIVSKNIIIYISNFHINFLLRTLQNIFDQIINLFKKTILIYVS